MQDNIYAAGRQNAAKITHTNIEMHRFSVVAVHCIFKTLYIGPMILSCVFGYLNGFPKIEHVFALRATTLIGSKKPD